MAIFLDSCFYFALLAKKDVHHQRAQTLWQEIAIGTYGKIYSSDYVLDESLTLLNIRTHGKRTDLLLKMNALFLGIKPLASLIKIEPNWLEEISKLQLKLTKDNEPVSFTDASNIVACKKNQISHIISFDGHFEGLLDQIK